MDNGDIIVRNYPKTWTRADLDRFLIDNKIGTPTRIKLHKEIAFVTFEEANFSILARTHNRNFQGIKFEHGIVGFLEFIKNFKNYRISYLLNTTFKVDFSSFEVLALP